MKNLLIGLFFGACLLSTISYRPTSSAATGETTFAPQIVRLDQRLDQIVPPNAVLERVAEGFTWAEGPAWNRTGGYLLLTRFARLLTSRSKTFA